MFRRWLIRMPLLVALAFVVSVWVGSYFGGIGLQKCVARREWDVGAVQGLAYMSEVSGDFPNQPLRMTAPNHLSGPKTLGFSHSSWQRFPDILAIVFPLWFPTIILSVLCLFVWRKTRAKYNGRGFPVEPAQDTAKSK